jgi:hypothetical protein
MLQIDLRSGFLVGLPDTTLDPVQNGFDIGGTLYGDYTLGENFKLSFEDQLSSLTGLGGGENETEDGTNLDGVTSASKRLPAPEQNVFADNRGSIALSYRGYRVGYENRLFGDSRTLEPRDRLMQNYFGIFDPTYTYTFQYYRNMRQMYEGEYEFETDRFEADASLHYIVTGARIDSMVDFTTRHNSRAISTSAALTDLSGGIRIPEARMKVIAAARVLSDFTGSSGFDSYDYSLTIAGDASFLENELDYRLKSEFYSQGYLFDTAEAEHAITGFFHTLYLRNNLTIGKGLRLKGFAVVTFNGALFKQRYEFGIRQGWFNGSSVEAGASTITGGLFPMVGYYLRTTIRPIDPLSFKLRLKSMWDWPRRDETEFSSQDRTLFIKAIFGGEIAYRVTLPFELYCGGDYTYFNPSTAYDFPTRLYLGGGARFNLP